MGIVKAEHDMSTSERTVQGRDALNLRSGLERGLDRGHSEPKVRALD